MKSPPTLFFVHAGSHNSSSRMKCSCYKISSVWLRSRSPRIFYCVLLLVLGADAADTLVPLAFAFKSFSTLLCVEAYVNSDTVHCYRPSVAPLFVAPSDFHCSVPWFLYVSKMDCNAKCIFSVVNMTISKLDLDLHLSESDWCRLVVHFRLSYFGSTPTLQ
jgi:hypothetical protein